jgi:hypothetical protein
MSRANLIGPSPLKSPARTAAKKVAVPALLNQLKTKTAA